MVHPQAGPRTRKSWSGHFTCIAVRDPESWIGKFGHDVERRPPTVRRPNRTGPPDTNRRENARLACENAGR